MNQAELEELENEADLLVEQWWAEFEAEWQARPANEPPLELDEQTLAILMEMDNAQEVSLSNPEG